MGEPREYYVYALCLEDRQTPFYIGKGHRFRIGQHETEARSGKRGRKNDIIRRVIAAIGHLPVVKLAVDLTEEVAFRLETECIVTIGRADLGFGPLVNQTDGGEGASGYRQTAEDRAKKSMAASRPEAVERRRAEMEWRKENTDWLRKLSEAQRRVRADPDKSEALLAIMRQAFADPEVQQRRRANHIVAVRDPEYRQRLSIALSKSCERPEIRQMKRAAANARWRQQWTRDLLFISALLSA